MGNNVYFLSDLHLGASYLDSPLDYERRVVRWLRSIEGDARELYLLGDVLDYWYEYRNVVPRGFTRFLGQLAMMADAGIKITWLTGNHDIWIFDYLPSQLGITVVDGNLVTEIDGKRFFLSHGDRVGKRSFGFKLMCKLFRNRACQLMFAAIHPRWTVELAHRWSAGSRGYDGTPALPDEKVVAPLVAWAEDYQLTNPSRKIDFFVTGHRHVMLDEALPSGGRLLILGDWIHHFSYGRWDGKTMVLEQFDDKMHAKS